MWRTLLLAAICALGCRTEIAEIPDTADPYYGLSDSADSGRGVDTAPEPVDADGDGHASIETGGDDCDDDDAAVNPSADEICSPAGAPVVDDDCDGAADDDDPEGASDAATWHADTDGDGYGDEQAVVVACEQPSGYLTAGEWDCDDSDAAYHPGADESDCADPNDYNCDGSVGYADEDGDGWAACEECDDGAADINPASTEICNGLDDDCDGAADDDDPEGASDAGLWYADADADGYGDESAAASGCEAPAGYVGDDGATGGWDCDDGDDSAYPGATESCDDADDDCDGDVDEDAADASTWYLDFDGDGYGAGGFDQTACPDSDGDGPTGYVATDDDCDDGDDAIYPGASETCDAADQDCDGSIDEGAASTTWYADDDGDGYGDADDSAEACDQPEDHVSDDSDCDDGDAGVHPGAAELCDEMDQDCDGAVDEGAAAGTWYADADSDGYGDAGSAVEACDQPTDHVSDSTDCDDASASVYPGAAETCDDADQDCDGAVDEDAVDPERWYADDDGDGHPDTSDVVEACDQPSGYLLADGSFVNSDCDDDDADTHPDATEICDAADQDCDGGVDEGASEGRWYADADADGYGDAGTIDTACEQPSGYVADSTDCDDGEAGVNPGAAESCDEVDQDCDGGVDEGVAETFYADADADGYPDESDSQDACAPEAGYISADAASADWDCDDADGAVHPDAEEVCNGLDDDCDGRTDLDASDRGTWYLDSDGDGYGGSASTIGCEAPTGYVADAGDCDDSDAAINPDGEESCDNNDEDCDGAVDEGTPTTTWYADGDGDGYGGEDETTAGCEQPSGYVADSTDCDDGDATVYPDAPELCDWLDNDCDGALMTDADGDDADGDGIANCEDAEVYAEDFSGSISWTEHQLTGAGSPTWTAVGGALYEGASSTSSMLYTDDLGELETFTISVDIYNVSGDNNASGLLFGLDDSSGDYYGVFWTDPNGYYGTGVDYVSLAACSGTSCTVLAQDDGSVDVTTGADRWATLEASVDGDDVTVSWDGYELFTHTESGASPMGLGGVGLFSWDNDAGVFFDDFVISNP